MKNKKKSLTETGDPLESFPKITIQLPVYNERYVITRLIDSVAKLNWPKEQLEIQVLDDSTDETTAIIEDKIAGLQKKGFDVMHICRDSREGYKAGALQHGLQQSSGEFIAIFDADFVPSPDFLKKTVPYFQHKEIGMVQTRWTHINKNYSLLTRMQAFALDAHFSVEQKGRNSAGYFMNFNGTAGVWRKSCIKDAGGWQADTLTEDLDLSYRAQMNGWKFKYLENVESPAELPVAISAIKSQQYRWTKGAAESARKHLAGLWKSDVSFLKKIHGSSHLLSSGIFILMFVLSVLSVPLLWVKHINFALSGFFSFFGFFSLGLFGWILFYGSSYRNETDKKLKKILRFILMFPVFLSLSMAFSLNNSIAVIKGYFKKPSPFIRTPKFNITKLGDSWTNNKYLFKKMNAQAVIEGLLAIYFLGGIITAIIINDWGFFLFHLLLFLGFGTVFGYSVYENSLK